MNRAGIGYTFVMTRFLGTRGITIEPGLCYQGLGGCELISKAPYKWEIP